MLASQERRTGRQQRKKMRSWYFDSFLQSYFAVWKAYLVFHPSGSGGGGEDIVHLPSSHGLTGTPTLPKSDIVSRLEATISRFPLRIS